MRLTEHQLEMIIAVFSKYLANINAELRLYGSRVDDTLKGGDIDLLLITETQTDAVQLKEKKPYILNSLMEKIGEQRIDLGIITRKDLAKHPFYSSILPKSEHIHSWGT